MVGGDDVIVLVADVRVNGCAITPADISPPSPLCVIVLLLVAKK